MYLRKWSVYLFKMIVKIHICLICKDTFLYNFFLTYLLNWLQHKITQQGLICHKTNQSLQSICWSIFSTHWGIQLHYFPHYFFDKFQQVCCNRMLSSFTKLNLVLGQGQKNRTLSKHLFISYIFIDASEWVISDVSFGFGGGSGLATSDPPSPKWPSWHWSYSNSHPGS